MSALRSRIMKEARPLFWPWCGFTLVAALPLLPGAAHIQLGDWSPSWFVAVAILSALPFGNEFEHRSVSLVLVQPIERLQIWREKFLITFVAVVSTGFLYFMGSRSVFSGDPGHLVFITVFFSERSVPRHSGFFLRVRRSAGCFSISWLWPPFSFRSRLSVRKGLMSRFEDRWQG